MLCLVENEKPVRDGAPADVAERLDLDQSRLEEGIVAAFAPGSGKCSVPPFARTGLLLPFGIALLGREDELEGVVDRLQPGIELFLK